MKKLLSLLVGTSLLFGLVACGNNASSGTPTPQSQPPATGGTPSSEPEPEPVPLEPAFLTGYEKTADYPEGQRICAIMVNNIAMSRPTRGLSEAQMLVEIKVEGGITRFMALYEDYKAVPEVGSVRSARDQFFQLILPFWAFYVHDGESTVQAQYVKDWGYQPFDLSTGRYGGSTKDPNNLGSLAWRDEQRAALFNYQNPEFTEYTRGDHIEATVLNNELDDFRSYGSPIFSFVPYTDPARVPAEGSTNEVAIIHSGSYRTYFEFDGSRYQMSQWNSHRAQLEGIIDEGNGQQLAFDNVLVIFAPMSLYPNSPLVKVDYGLGGAGYYFSQGGYEMVFWRKGGPQEPLRIMSSDGTEQPVLINTGTTYLAVVDDNELEKFHNALKAGDAENAAIGDANPNETDTND